MAVAPKAPHKQLKKIERVEARLNPEQKRRIEYAASLQGTSISDFIVSSADDAAVQAIEQHEVWTLTGRDREALSFRGRKIGKLLLLDAFKRVLENSREVASAVVAVDARDERAREFYLRHDFIPLPSQPSRLFYTAKTI